MRLDTKKAKRYLIVIIFIGSLAAIGLGVYWRIQYIESQKGYGFGVPDYAKGVDTYNEIKEYDKDEWREHVGTYEGPDDIFGGQADREGAVDKSEILSWKREKDDIHFFADLVLEAEVTLDFAPSVANFYDIFDWLAPEIWSLTDLGGSPILLMALWKTQGWNGTSGNATSMFQNINTAFLKAFTWNFDSNYVRTNYDIVMDGYILKRDYWEWTKDPYENYPDKHRDDVPFLKDAGDWWKTYEILASLKKDLFDQLGVMKDGMYESIAAADRWRISNPANWTTFNNTWADTFKLPLFFGAVPPISQGGDNLYKVWIEAALDPTGNNWIQQQMGIDAGLEAAFSLLGSKIPSKAGFLYNLLIEGLPTMSPPEKYLPNILNDYDIDEELEQGIVGLDSTTWMIVDAWLKDGNTIVMEFKFADPSETRKGWKAEFTYGSLGTQDSVVFKGSDVFFMIEGLESSLERRVIPLIYGILIFVVIAVISVITVVVVKKVRKSLKEGRLKSFRQKRKQHTEH